MLQLIGRRPICGVCIFADDERYGDLAGRYRLASGFGKICWQFPLSQKLERNEVVRGQCSERRTRDAAREKGDPVEYVEESRKTKFPLDGRAYLQPGALEAARFNLGDESHKPIAPGQIGIRALRKGVELRAQETK